MCISTVDFGVFCSHRGSIGPVEREVQIAARYKGTSPVIRQAQQGIMPLMPSITLIRSLSMKEQVVTSMLLLSSLILIQVR
ncbi:hypothetical protein D5086_028652 [Populus alba]|uniref:Uncharacterized protein n=1 Tax=Populus alba TaxID=43335 RepID=A0ACC4AS72_POPAL